MEKDVALVVLHRVPPREQSEAKNSADHGGEHLAMSGGAALDGADHGSEHSATSGAMSHGWVAAARQASEPEARTRRAVESVGCSWAGPDWRL